MPVLRPSGSDFTSFVKAAAQYVAPGRTAKVSKSGGVPVALPGLGAIVRASQVGALASPTTSAVIINGVTPPAAGPPPPPPLYNFTAFTFSSAGTSGRFGPTLAAVTSHSTYIAQSSWTGNTEYLNMYAGYQGIQVWTVPKTGSYQVVCAGASPNPAPKAAVVTATVTLNQGQTILLLVGQVGGLASGGTIYGGSGGSFVARPGGTGTEVSAATCIIAAGGAGGYDTGLPDATASSASITTAGRDGGMEGGYSGDNIDYDGGNAYRFNGYGGGGGGFIGNGIDANIQNNRNNAGKGGKSFRNGGVGGALGWATAPDGGFGGGGSGGLPDNKLAGGGGFAGGGGANVALNAGGGGGSSLGGLSGSVTLTNGGAGYITITSL